jgi:hypothetical protein
MRTLLMIMGGVALLAVLSYLVSITIDPADRVDAHVEVSERELTTDLAKGELAASKT